MPALDRGWSMAPTPAGAWARPPGSHELEWVPAVVPGTVAAALARLGSPEPLGENRIDHQDWWFRVDFDVPPLAEGQQLVLRLEGVATVWEAFLDGEPAGNGESMFAATEIDVGARPGGAAELALCCRALGPRLEQRRRPRARWRTRLAEGNLRFFRTSLLGRAPGFSPGPPAIGPWRPVTLEQRRGPVPALRLRPRLQGDEGVLAVQARLGEGDRVAEGVSIRLDGPSGSHGTMLRAERIDGGWIAQGELVVPAVARWWPHTHGPQPLHRVKLMAGQSEIASGRVGFRSLAAGAERGHDAKADGLDLHVNGVRVFARGAVWTPVDPVGLAAGEAELREALEQVRDAGMNMLRLPGTGIYESDAFHDLCDELGLLVWQDFMFANFDYPVQDAAFRAVVEEEAEQLLEGLAGRPSLVVLCGNSEVEQQVAMLGLDPRLGRGELFGEILPRLVEHAEADAVYLPSAPCGGELPFTPSHGVSNYFGVGGYRRPLSDARLAGVRFASECLAFANLGDERPTDDVGVPRDVGSSWDFADVRDHYLELLYGVDAGELADSDPDRYAELSRAVSGEVMAEVMGEWRRAGSPCGGGLVLCLRDLVPGAGWGIVDVGGVPKVAYHHLRRVLAPTAVWTTDEGLGGIAVHAANDGSELLRGRLRVSLYRDAEQPVDEAEIDCVLQPHGAWTGNAEGVLGHFRDVAYAYRFGPPTHDAVVVSLLEGDRLLSQAVRFPTGRPVGRRPPEELGLEAALELSGQGAPGLVLRSRRLVWGVRPHVPGYVLDDDAFTLEPGRERRVGLRLARSGAGCCKGVAVTALNMDGELAVADVAARA